MFEDDPSRPQRASQIWQILISYAHTKQTLTYEKLAQLLGYRGAGVLAQTLEHIMRWCEEQDVPPLTALVIGKSTKKPGSGLTAVTNFPNSKKAVFDFSWFRVVPPTERQLKDVYERGR